MKKFGKELRTKITNREKHSLIEVEVTLHPEAIHEALVGRDGCLWKMMRLALLVVVSLLALGTELAMPRYYPEVPLRPLTLLIAYVACHSPMAGGLLVAWCGGFLLDAGNGMLPGCHVLQMVLMAVVANAMGRLPAWEKMGGWAKAALVGGCGYFLAVAYEALLMFFSPEWSILGRFLWRELLLGTALAAVSAGPALFFCMDCLAAWGTGKKLFLPRQEEAPEGETMQLYRP